LIEIILSWAHPTAANCDFVAILTILKQVPKMFLIALPYNMTCYANEAGKGNLG
jgi:hypothetical protein